MDEIVNKNIYKKVSITPSGWFGNSKDMIVELENFMTEEEIEFLEKSAKSITIWDVTESHTNENGTVIYDANYWKDRVATRPSLDKNDPKIGPVIEGLFHRLQPIIEDFWLPRREGGKGTEITTLPAGQNLGEMEDVKYFRNKLLNALNVPISRLEPQGGGLIGVGRSTEVTRDEVKFMKFIGRLRNKFTQLFDDALRVQLVLKNICTQEEWDEFKEYIYYDFRKDNNFTELSEVELTRERLNLLTLVDPFVGRYYSQQWIKKHVLRFTDEEIKQMDKELQDESENLPEAQQGPVLGANQPQTEGVSATEFPPQNNTQEDGTTESLTPQLDAEVEKYSLGINRK